MNPALYAAAVYTGMRTTGGRRALLSLDFHARRLVESDAVARGLPAPHAPAPAVAAARGALLSAAARAVAEARPGGGELKMLAVLPLGAPPSQVAVRAAEPLEEAAAPARAWLAGPGVRRDTPAAKATAWAVARAPLLASAAGRGEPLLTDGRRRVLEGATSNFFAVLRGGTLQTCPDGPLLRGHVRGLVLDQLAPALGLEVDLAAPSLDDLEAGRWEGAFLVSCTRMVVPLREVAGHRLDPDCAVALRLREAAADERWLASVSTPLTVTVD